MTNLGASLGTALAGSLLIATLTSAFLANIQQSPAIPDSVTEQAQVELAVGVAFVSDAILAVLALLALFLAQSIPTRPIGVDERKE